MQQHMFETPCVRETTKVEIPTESVTMVRMPGGGWTVGVNMGPLPSIFEASSLDEALIGVRRRVTVAADRVPVDSDEELF